jgi:RNA polymerase sigma-70 factor, ECF subfamily
MKDVLARSIQVRVETHGQAVGAFRANVVSDASGTMGPQAAPTPTTRLAAVHAEHAEFVWATLQRFGVRQADLQDVSQEVFLIVQRKLPSFDGACPLTTWLFAICRRVVAGMRRRARFRLERLVDDVDDIPDPAFGPEETAARRQATHTLSKVLDGMELDRRAVFVMFEIDELGCDAIAEITGVPVGTVYSRLHAARKEFAKLLGREQAKRPSRGGP